MRFVIAAAAALAALLFFVLWSPCGRDGGPQDRICRDPACVPAARSGWTQGNRFLPLSLPRLAFPLPRDATDCSCWS